MYRQGQSELTLQKKDVWLTLYTTRASTRCHMP